MFFKFLNSQQEKEETDYLSHIPKPNFDNTEQGYIAEGRGNGSLSPVVVRDAENYWNGGHSEDDFYVGYDFHPWDWDALFLDELKFADYEYIEEDSFEVREKRRFDKFQECMSQYPLLSRIWDMYQDAGYNVNEVGQLRAQCLELQSRTANEKVIRALGKLILACDKALKRKMGLLLVSD